MKDLISIKIENDQQLLSARDLHKGLGLKRRFTDWVKQNFKDFEEGIDSNDKEKNRSSLKQGRT